MEAERSEKLRQPGVERADRQLEFTKPLPSVLIDLVRDDYVMFSRIPIGTTRGIGKVFC